MRGKNRTWRRGMALGVVISIAVLVLLMGMLMASLSVLDLNLAEGYHEGAQAEMVARAAIAQFIHEEYAAISSPLVLQGGQVDLAARYRRPVFPDGGSNLPGHVDITFDTTSGYYSTDNSLGEGPAASYFDRGTARLSVPPFSVDLVMTVTCGRRTCHYEAVLERRWPYALYTENQISLMSESPHLNAPAIPTIVKGNVYSSGVDVPSVELPVNDNYVPVLVPGATFNNITDASQVVPAGQVQVGGLVPPVVACPGNACVVPMGSVTSTGNILQGRVDLQTNLPVAGRGLAVAPGNTGPASANLGVQGRRSAAALDGMFTLPDPSSYTKVIPASQLAYNPRLPKQFFLLKGNMCFGTPATGFPGYVFPGGQFYVPGGMGNRYLISASTTNPPAATGVVMQTNASIQLQDCTVFVDGELDLGNTVYARPDPDTVPSGSPAPAPTLLPSLTGSNATLIVNGPLIVSNGSLNAQDQGMVIFCKKLVMQASGQYHGLILVQDTALFFPSTDGASGGLSIDGALVTGGRPIVVQAVGPSGHAGTVMGFSGATLWGTSLQYDPRYLKSLNQYGTFQVLALRRWP